ncbi:Gp37-like protein [Paenarthrobacter nitroguajacolicus]|uniref:Gp37-like protein n=1 Tax=Paenarthrobacter nitroguajacolicus TaxID=211146 RepID=UPI003D1BE67D
MKNPFKLTIYDKAFNRKGWLGDAIEVHATPRFNLAGSLEITVSTANAKLGLLNTSGTRLTCEYDGEQIISGPVRIRSGHGPHLQGTVSVTVEDDFRLLNNTLGWPVPAAGLGGQSVEYYTVTGPAETVLKDIVQKNIVTRLGRPLTVAPSLGRGATITASIRFHPIYDRLFPAVEAAGLGVTIKQSGAGLVLDVFEPSLYKQELTEASGVVTEWDWSNEAPQASRGVIGGKGEGVLRAFQAFNAASRETEWGDVIEVFRDARDTEDGDVYGQRAAETLAETSEKSGLSLKLSETKEFRYGRNGLKVGNKVPFRVGPSLLITDVLREAQLSWTRDEGLNITPKVGDITDSADLIFARAIKRNSQDIRDFRSSR